MSLVSRQVRETETWMPMKTAQTAAMLSHRDTPESSGSDFGFADDEDERNRGEGDGDDDDYIDTLYDDEDEYEDEDFSGSGDGGSSLSSIKFDSNLFNNVSMWRKIIASSLTDTTVPPRGEPDRSAQVRRFYFWAIFFRPTVARAHTHTHVFVYLLSNFIRSLASTTTGSLRRSFQCVQPPTRPTSYETVTRSHC